MSKHDVVLLDFWVSPFCIRVKMALAEKGVAYVNQEEDLHLGKSRSLIRSNPVYQKVPVLLHNGKPICESTNIVYYIDETWPSPPLLPSCPYARSRARFWANFIDKKVFEASSKIWMSKKEEKDVANKEFIEILKVLEGALGEKDYFGGDNFGFVDIIAISVASRFCTYEKFGGFKVEDHCPKFAAWMKRCMERESVSKVLPCPEDVHEFLIMLRMMHGIE
ncbi:unnamed protein product [Ilex paraguariensis]|uniref:glutathione transferase n=1 Tax=Ilex paraguariensis TaxID=185542 RepID=A0ABC8TLI8_9AQUA